MLYISAFAEDWPDEIKLVACPSDEVMPLLTCAVDGDDITVRLNGKAEVLAEAPEVDRLYSGNVVEPQPTSIVDGTAVVDAPILFEVGQSVEAEARSIKAVEVDIDQTSDSAVSLKPGRFKLVLTRSLDVIQTPRSWTWQGRQTKLMTASLDKTARPDRI